jgi:cyclophilin family peptidyl-prolyl cis-trans isomerase
MSLRASAVSGGEVPLWRARRAGAAGDAESGPGAKEPRRSALARWLPALHLALTAALALGCLWLLLARAPPAAPPTAPAAAAPAAAATPPPALSPIEPLDVPAELKSLQVRIERKQMELEGTRGALEDVRRQSGKRERDLSKKVAELEAKLQQVSASAPGAEDSAALGKLRKRDEALSKNVARQSEAIAKLSREILRARFGEREPYRARITVQFPAASASASASATGEPSEPELGDITVELAPSSLMPTAVLYWLSQVQAGLWDGCAFIRNAHHVLQASAQSMDRKYLHQRFKTLPWQGESVPFQEYSPAFPHQKYTLGLAGRPGGPDFYISTVDNAKNHGPGGQGSYDLPSEADSCFAKVIGGFDVVDRMHKAPNERDSFEGLVHFIGIKQIEILDAAH